MHWGRYHILHSLWSSYYYAEHIGCMYFILLLWYDIWSLASQFNAQIIRASYAHDDNLWETDYGEFLEMVTVTSSILSNIIFSARLFFYQKSDNLTNLLFRIIFSLDITSRMLFGFCFYFQSFSHVPFLFCYDFIIHLTLYFSILLAI